MWNIKLVNRGKELTLRILTDGEVGQFSPTAFSSNLSHNKLTISTALSVGDVLEWALAGKTFDYALPLSFVEAYKEEHGCHPRGVWVYELGDVFGLFRSYNDALDAMWEAIYDSLEVAQWEELPEWVKRAQREEEVL